MLRTHLPLDLFPEHDRLLRGDGDPLRLALSDTRRS